MMPTNDPALTARLVDLIDLRIPHDAFVVIEGDRALVAYPGYPVDDGEPVNAVFVLGGPGTPIRYGTFRTATPVHLSVDEAARVPAQKGMVFPLREPVRNEAPSRAPLRRRALRLLVQGMDAIAIETMERGWLCGEAELDWLSTAREGSVDARALATSHPWLVPAAVEADAGGDVREAIRASGPDAAAVSVLRSLVGRDDPGLPGLAARMAGTALPQVWDVVSPAHVDGLLAIPPDLFPSTSPGTEDGRQDRLAMIQLAPMVGALRAATGRGARSIVGRSPSWRELVLTMSRRSGLDETPEDFPGDWGLVIAADAMSNAYDMARAFAREVLSPALLDAGRPWTGDHATGAAVRSIPSAVPADPVMAAAVRLLAGTRTLAGFSEVSGRWHARSDAIARFMGELVGDDVSPGPSLFPDLDLGGGHYLTCLNTPRALLDEGSPDAGSDGVPGLSHCVGGFGREVTLGTTFILSLRRRLPDGGYARVSTAEVDFSTSGVNGHPHVVQHRGLRNAPPDAAARRLLRNGLRRVKAEASAAIAAFVPGDRAWPEADALILRTRSWERVRDLWSFALTRPQRAMGMRELLAEAGLSHASDGPPAR